MPLQFSPLVTITSVGVVNAALTMQFCASDLQNSNITIEIINMIEFFIFLISLRVFFLEIYFIIE
jgi:hypothetical protein